MSVTLTEPSLATRVLSLLAQHEARARRSQPRPLRTIELTLIADARRGLSGDADWPAEQVERLADQVVSGRFGRMVPGVVDRKAG